MTELMKKTAASLTAHGFEVYTVATAPVAKELMLSLIPEGASVGIGGSVTIRDLGVVDELQKKGHDVFWHWLPYDDMAKLFDNAHHADVYLSSVNALTGNGDLVNIDRTGNRVAATIYGPKTVILAVGVNKLVDGGITTAIGRIKQYACPPNARRLNVDTPCARTGKCNAAECGDNSLCGVTTIMQRPPKGHRVIVVLINQAMGY